jgi:hypothetical protein
MKKQAEKASKIEVKEKMRKIKNILSSHEKERELKEKGNKIEKRRKQERIIQNGKAV